MSKKVTKPPKATSKAKPGKKPQTIQTEPLQSQIEDPSHEKQRADLLAAQLKEAQIKEKSEKKTNPNPPLYKTEHADIYDILQELGITVKDGILVHPNRLSASTEDVTGILIDYRSSNGLPPITHALIFTTINEWINKTTEAEYLKLKDDVKYKPDAENKWKEMMKITFNREDNLDMWTLMHQIWLIKRRIYKLPVDQIHKPMLVNLHGAKNLGKSLFFEKYLLKPLPSSMMQVCSDMAQVFNDQREHDVFASNFAIVFGERAKNDKVVVEMLKQLIDTPVLSRRNLGHNSHSRLPKNAALFSTSNKRMRESIADEDPRKWYEIDFPDRTQEEVEAYVKLRDEIDPLGLWQCIDENSESDPFLDNWDEIQTRISAKCRFVHPAVRWIIEYVNAHNSDFAKYQTVKWLFDLYEISNTKKQYAIPNSAFTHRLRDLGFKLAKVNGYNNCKLTSEGLDDIVKRAAEFDVDMEVQKDSTSVDGVIENVEPTTDISDLFKPAGGS